MGTCRKEGEWWADGSCKGPRPGGQAEVPEAAGGGQSISRARWGRQGAQRRGQVSADAMETSVLRGLDSAGLCGEPD